MLKRIISVNLIVLSLSIIAISSNLNGADSGRITILYTNDMHSQFLPAQLKQKDSDEYSALGGMEALFYFVNRERAKYSANLVLDAGDIMTGNPISTLEVEGMLGGGFVQMMNLIGYDVMTIGNHEFDNGPDNIIKLFDLAEFDVISANVLRADTLFAPAAYKIYRVGPVRVGVIGLMLEKLSEVVNKKQIEGIVVTDISKTAQQYIDEIDPLTDLLILLTHNGYYADKELAQSIHGADVIIGGHSHTRLQKPEIVNDVLIVQTGNACMNLGKLELEVAADTISWYHGELIPMWVDSMKSRDEHMTELVTSFEQRIDTEYGKVIGTLHTDWRRSHLSESNIGNWLTDAIRDITDSEIALINSGGIRKNLKSGPIRKLDIVEILPFTNMLVTFECTGEELLTFIQENAESAAFRKHGMLQISGLRYEYSVNGDAVKILAATVNGKPVDKNRTYHCVSLDYVLFGQEMKYLGFKSRNTKNLGIAISDAIIDYIQQHPEVSSKVENRALRR